MEACDGFSRRCFPLWVLEAGGDRGQSHTWGVAGGSLTPPGGGRQTQTPISLADILCFPTHTLEECGCVGGKGGGDGMGQAARPGQIGSIS